MTRPIPRYVFAKVTQCHTFTDPASCASWYGASSHCAGCRRDFTTADVTDTPAPSPDDWQAIVRASSRCQDATTDEESRTAREELEDLVFAAVRNMRKADDR